MASKINGIAIAELIVGVVFFWSGFKNQNLTTTLKDFLHGTVPQKVPEATPSLGLSGASSSATSAAGGGAGGVPYTGSGKYSGPHLTVAQMASYWRLAGGPASLANTMGAIGMAESGGNPNATNPTDNGGTQTSWGLWQISLGNHNAPSSTWYNPLENARLAVGKYHSQGLTAWGTYTSGAFRQYLPQGSLLTVGG
jgi:hypothetical protein